MQALLGEDLNLKADQAEEAKSKPKKFEADILVNTFSYTINGKTVLINAFVKSKTESMYKKKLTQFEIKSVKLDSELKLDTVKRFLTNKIPIISLSSKFHLKDSKEKTKYKKKVNECDNLDSSLKSKVVHHNRKFLQRKNHLALENQFLIFIRDH